MAKDKTPVYDESSIKVLKGLEPVRQRPGMYTRLENPLHIIQEVIDNAVDEALGGYANTLVVEMLADGRIQVADNGRGIPVGLHPEENIPTVQLVYTRLHAGGKFDKTDAESGYAFSGGLHGVGVAVTNALSDELTVVVHREGKQWEVGFANGELDKPLRKIGATSERGTTVTVRPNPKYFDSPIVPVAALRTVLRSKAALLPGLRVTFVDTRDGTPKEEVWEYTDGLRSLLEDLVDGEEPLAPAFHAEWYATEAEGTYAAGEGAAFAFGWYEDGGSSQSFTNLIHTCDGGTHVSGLKHGIFEAIRLFIELHNMTQKGIKLTADDVFRNVAYVLSAKVLDPQFAGQVKDKLISREAVNLISKSVRIPFEGWLNHNTQSAKVIAELALRNAATRQRAGTKAEKRKTSSVVMLPGKLTQCASEDIAENELFLVEGDSAGGSAKKARNKDLQAILPLRGKGVNTRELDADKSMENNEVNDISIAIGIPLHTKTGDVAWDNLRYGKVIIMADADVDGSHIQVLLLTMFFTHFPQLIHRGHVYIAQPPLYRLDVDGAGKTRLPKKLYIMNASELATNEERLKKEGYSNWTTSRFKGLGEMNVGDLWETTLRPETRTLLQVRLPLDLETDANEMFDNLMVKKRSGWRRQWMEQYGDEVVAE